MANLFETDQSRVAIDRLVGDAHRAATQRDIKNVSARNIYRNGLVS